MRVTLNPMTAVLTEEERQTQRRSHVKTEPQARDAWAPTSWKRQEGPLLEAREGVRPCRTWISEFWPQNQDGVTPVLRLSVCGALLQPPQDTRRGTASLFSSPAPRPEGLAQAWSG